MKSLIILLLLLPVVVRTQVYTFPHTGISAWQENNHCLVAYPGYADTGKCEVVYRVELIEPQRSCPPDLKISFVSGDSNCLKHNPGVAMSQDLDRITLEAYCATMVIPRAEKVSDSVLLELFYAWSANVGPDFFQSLLNQECRKRLAYLIAKHAEPNTADQKTRERATWHHGRENKK